ncbi:ABC transporter substrate-binding protein [Trujillonella endophytica]|uniref:Taurine transport system substrate-binding protein n=1 Tax=Trujillonella endophytica TaxID=673521 RepID=A0A1H8W9F1_9ACTN|nr:ABC transporter substrate-binding protein [Trujillella endophytica]SEP24274.1 taurine transport system substrate-binding protein [Trujillella endophytica]
MSTPRGWRRLAAALSLTALVTGVAACGDDGDSAEGDGGGAGTIRIAYQAFPSGDLIVKDQGWLEDALPEYDIEWTKFDSGASINTAFVADSVDIAAIGSSPVARGLSAPLDIPYQVTWILDVAGDNEALVAREGTGIESVEDLVGHKVATPFSSTSHYSLLAALDAAGVDSADVDLIDLQPQDIVAAWTRGDIDAAYTWLPSLSEIQQTGSTLITSRELAGDGKPTLDLGVASTEFIEANPEAISAWRQVQARALRLIAEDPDAAAEAVGRQLGISPEEAAEQLSQGVFLDPTELTTAEWLGTPDAPGNLAANLQDAGEFLVGQQQIPEAPSLEDLQAAIYTDGLEDDVSSDTGE